MLINPFAHATMYFAYANYPFLLRTRNYLFSNANYFLCIGKLSFHLSHTQLFSSPLRKIAVRQLLLIYNSCTCEVLSSCNC